jgi:hypothetical protein
MNRSAAFLRPGEEVIVELDGVVTGYTRWSGLGSVFGILLALSIPRLLELNFVAGAVVIVAVITGVFLLLYYVVGRRLAKRAAPPMDSPYLVVALTRKRVLLLDRGLGSDEPKLIEAASVNDVGTVRYRPAGLLMPQRLGYVVAGADRREFEFPRNQQVGTFVEHLG